MELTIETIKSIFSVRDFQRGRMYVANLQSKKAALLDMGKIIDNIGYIRYNNYEINPIFWIGDCCAGISN